MCPTEYEQSYRRHLPHIQPAGATFFVTCRLAGSLPLPVQEALRSEAERISRELANISDEPIRTKQAHLSHRRLFGRWDTALRQADSGPVWLRQAPLARLIADSLHHRDGEVYNLLAYCIMPNHVHIVFSPLPDSDDRYPSVTAIMQSLKAYTAREANKLLDRQGQFWQRESYDHWVRNSDELRRIVRYVIDNPVKANLVNHWQDWPWTYCKYPP